MKKGFIRKIENKGFKNFSLYDNFIQKCLDCYTILIFQEYYDITGRYSKYLHSLIFLILLFIVIFLIKMTVFIIIMREIIILFQE